MTEPHAQDKATMLSSTDRERLDERLQQLQCFDVPLTELEPIEQRCLSTRFSGLYTLPCIDWELINPLSL